ncbi:MAG: hypothetical protein JST00_26790 [Deltaproteobacteria bacterium]|nr:hypothetical protein [Deltaproteobacteria bacterium]
MLVGLAPSDDDARAYTAPGQYVEVAAPHERGYFVLASPVGARPWELLVRDNGEAAALLVASPLGTELDVSRPQGAGFALDRLRGRPLVIAVVASALGAARALVAARLDERSAEPRPPTTVLVGVRSAVDVPLAVEVEAWIADGIEVVLCLSRAELDAHRDVLPRAVRAHGYVQAVVQERRARGLLAAGAVIAGAGPAPMLADLRTFADPTGGQGGAGPLEVLVNVG